jgi:hypothetical protein
MIYLLWCTIRPEQFIYTHKIWMDRAFDRNNFQTYVAVNYEQDKKVLEGHVKDVFLVETDKIGVCYPSYYLSSNIGKTFATEITKKDIIVLASDDFIPPLNWDSYLINKLDKLSDISLMVRDGYQLLDSSNMLFPAITIPIMDYGCLLRLNRYIYHPDYLHMYSDCELYINLKEMNLLYDDRINDKTVFEHYHHINGKRISDQIDNIYYRNWEVDKKVWNERIKLNVKDRLK